MKALIFEEHSSVLPLWWEGREQARTVIYLDAHLDLQHISTERIARLAGCRTVEQVRSLEKPHFLSRDEGFSYSLEDFLYPASQLGLIERVMNDASFTRGARAINSSVLFRMDCRTISPIWSRTSRSRWLAAAAPAARYSKARSSISPM